MKLTALYAEEHFADILHAADDGEAVEIVRPDHSTYHLELVKPVPPFKRTTPRILGEGVGEMTAPSWEEWKAIDKELEREVNDRPLTSGDL